MSSAFAFHHACIVGTASCRPWACMAKKQCEEIIHWGGSMMFWFSIGSSRNFGAKGMLWYSSGEDDVPWLSLFHDLVCQNACELNNCLKCSDTMNMHLWHVQLGSSWLVSIKIQVWSRADVGLLKDLRTRVILDPPSFSYFVLFMQSNFNPEALFCAKSKVKSVSWC